MFRGWAEWCSLPALTLAYLIAWQEPGFPRPAVLLTIVGFYGFGHRFGRNVASQHLEEDEFARLEVLERGRQRYFEERRREAGGSKSGSKTGLDV